MDLSLLELDDALFEKPDAFDPDLLTTFLPDPFEITPSKSHPILDPFETVPLTSATSQNITIATSPTPAPSPAPPPPPAAPSAGDGSPLQENRPLNVADGGVRAKKKKRERAKKEPAAPECKALDKLAQRKLRNKESARRYREKQVARRRQLENYTRTLTEQNRELELLHERLIRLTCERGIENDAIPPVL